MNTLLKHGLTVLCICLLVASAADAQTNPAPELNLTLGEQRVKFAPTRSFQEMRLEVVNSAGETVFSHLTADAEFDWNLRNDNGEPLSAGLYSYVLTLKFSEERVRQHRGNLIVEQGNGQGQQPVWLTAEDGASVSGTSLNAMRSGGRSLAGIKTSEDNTAKRNVEGRTVAEEKSGNLNNFTKAARQEKAALLGIANMVAKFDGSGVNLIDSAITESGGNVGIGTTTPGSILDMVKPGATDVVFRMANGTRAWSVGVSGSGDFWRIRDNTTGAARLAIRGTNGNVGIGTTAPEAELEIDNENDGSASPHLFVTGHLVEPQIIGRQSRGTHAAPTATEVGNTLLFIGGRGHTGTAFVTGSKGAVQINANEDWSATANGTHITLETTSNGTTGRTERMRIDHDGQVGIGTTVPTATLSVNGTANKTGGGSWTVFSDERLKDIKGRYTTGWQALRKLQPIRFEYKADNALGLKNLGETIGFSAQAVAEAIPEAVSMTPQGYLQLNQDPILWTMLNAVKEQQAQIQQLLKNNRRLSQRVAQLERQGRNR